MIDPDFDNLPRSRTQVCYGRVLSVTGALVGWPLDGNRLQFSIVNALKSQNFNLHSFS